MHVQHVQYVHVADLADLADLASHADAFTHHLYATMLYLVYKFCVYISFFFLIKYTCEVYNISILL